MSKDLSKEEVKRILSTTPEQAAAEIMFREMLDYLANMTDEDMAAMNLAHEQRMNELLSNTALMLDQREIQEIKETVRFFKESGADVSYKPVRRVMIDKNKQTPVLEADISIMTYSDFTISGANIRRFLDILKNCGHSFDSRIDCEAIQIELSWIIGRYFKLG